MTQPRPIADGQEVAHVVGALLRLGFSLMRKNVNNSRYLRYGRVPFQVRVSTHEQPAHAQDKYPFTIYSRAITGPLTRCEVDLLALDIAVRFIAMTRDRQGLVRARENAA